MDDSAASLVLEDPPLSFESIVTARVPTYRNDVLVPGALESFDLPQVYQAGCPRRVTLINPRRGDQSPASDDDGAKALVPVSRTYEALGRTSNWQVITEVEQHNRSKSILHGFKGGTLPAGSPSRRHD